MLSGGALALALLVVLAGSMVMGLVSFGLGMVLSPPLLLIMEPQSVVVTINSLTIPILAIVLFRTWRQLSFKDVLPMVLAGVVGVPVGVLILDSVSPGALRIAIAVLILLLLVPISLKLERPFTHTKLTTPFFGFLGALLVTGMGVGTPLVVLYLVNQGWGVSALRASIAFYSLVVAIVAAVLYASMGFYTEERVDTLLKLTPMVVLGVVSASFMAQHIDDRKLRQVVLVVVALASITLLAREAAGIGQ